MIGRLRGLVAEVGEEDALIDVGGVGYVVRCGARTLGRLPAPGDETVIHVETQWSEATGQRLYGFLAREDRQAFVLLQGVQGVGPKAALGVLDVLSPGELAHAVAHDDKASVGRANGVGPKLAQRIIVELKDKPIAGVVMTAALGGGTVHGVRSTPTGDAVAALLGLGVADAAARRVVDHAAQRLGDGASETELIRAALKELGR